MLRIERAVAEFLQSLAVEQAVKLRVIHDLDLLLLMAGAEAVEEMEERHAGFDSR